MLYRFSHLLLYTVVLVGSYALEAPTRSSLRTNAPANTATNNGTILKAAPSLRSNSLSNARKQLCDGNDDTPKHLHAIQQTCLHNESLSTLHQSAVYCTEWQRRKLCTELLI